VDSKDFELLLALDENARQSYQSLGRKVSLSAPAVRDRLKRLELKGILQGFNLMINVSVFDRIGLVLFFRGNFTRKSALAALASPDVSWVNMKLDGQMIVGLWTKDEKKCTDYLVNILATKPSGRVFTPQSKCEPISLIDLSIMDALVDEPRLSVGELAKSTARSPKTVRKHLNLLLKTKTISVVPLHGKLADPGELVYPLVVTGRVNMNEVQRILSEAALLREIEDPPMKFILCRANSLADILSKTRVLEKAPGVNSVEISLNQEVLVSKELRHFLIRQEIAKLKNNRASSRRQAG
jgi:DNA-binding Lrp family transcriptional regulator